MRILIPILAILLGLLVALLMLLRTPKQAGPAQGPTPATPPIVDAAPETSTPESPDAPAAAINDSPPDAPLAPDTPRVEYGQLRSLTPDVGGDAGPRSIGSESNASDYRLKVDLVRWGSGIDSITLTDFYQEVNRPELYRLMDHLSASGHAVHPFSAGAVTINGVGFKVQDTAWEPGPVITDKTGQSVTYSLVIGADDGSPVLRVERQFSLAPDSHDLELRQTLTNLTGDALDVTWSQWAQGDVVDDGAAYLGDRRRFATGFFNPRDTNRTHVWTNEGQVQRLALLKSVIANQQAGDPVIGIWPNPDLNTGSRLVWLASGNRYFDAVTHPLLDATMVVPANVPDLETVYPHVYTVVLPTYAMAPGADPADRLIAFVLATEPFTIAPGGSHRVDCALFAGPREKPLLTDTASPLHLLNLDELRRYELGCTLCTFQWLARFLLSFLNFIHGIVADWGVAIIILVIVVRLILHPLTKKAQVNMMKLGKQMQALQPEMDKLRKKYKDDQAKLNQEMMRMYREKHINPANMLGCLPMFLQMPIWVALYAMLYYAIELRHQHAFYGVFQWIGGLFGRDWQFLASLSSPDRFITLFSEPAIINLYLIQLNFQSINILPLLLGVVFFFQQKLTTPPATTDQARQQQVMMKFMVLLFPIFLYSAPSGLTLYIFASTSAGIVDSYIVRRHVREQEAAGTLFDAKPRRGGGIMDRVAKAVEQRQAQMQQGGGQKSGGAGRKPRKH